MPGYKYVQMKSRRENKKVLWELEKSVQKSIVSVLEETRGEGANTIVRTMNQTEFEEIHIGGKD
jgi:hypothetical protein